MAGSKFLLRTGSLLLIATLAAGCIRQPVDDAALEGEDLGVVAAPLASEDVDRVAEDDQPAKERRRKKRRQREREAAQEQGAEAETTDGRPRPSGGGNGGGTNDGSTDAGGADPAQPAAQQQPFVALVDFEDRAGDAGGEAPAYADAQRLVIESNGSVARVSMAMAGDIPAALADGEVQGIGINFYRSEDRESDYQLFADGGYKGWRAFLHTPDGIVPYPGAFRVGANVLVFEIPWDALGGTKAARVGTFVDWSQKRTVLPASGNDRAPNDGTVTIRPARA